MFLITLVSETVDSRALVALWEDLWGLPFLIAIYCLPKDPNQWVYYVQLLCDLRLTSLLSGIDRDWRRLFYPTHPPTRSKSDGVHAIPVR